MKWLEIIELRMGGNQRQKVKEYLKSICEDLENDPNRPQFRIYANRDVTTDFSIHLHHAHGVANQDQRSLGYHIASVFKSFGLVNHTVWQEQEAGKEELKHPQENE